MSKLEVVFWIFVALTALQCAAGLIALYLWAFDLVGFPPNSAAAFLFGPLLTGTGAFVVAPGAFDV